MVRWVWILAILASAAVVADAGTLRTRDGKTYVGDITLASGQFSIATADGQTAAVAPADIAALDMRQTAAPTTTTAPATQPDAIGSGLRGEYFATRTFANSQIIRGDPNVAFNFSPPNQPIHGVDPNAWQDMSVRWTGRLRPRYSEQYSFFVPDNSFLRLWLDHHLVMDINQSTCMVTLKAGQFYDLQIDWVMRVNGGIITWEWSSASQGREMVPSECLFPPRNEPTMPPTAVVSAPAEGTVLAGPIDVPMSVSMHPGSSTPVQVAYRDGDALIGTSKTAPFDLNWAAAPVGDHHIIATVTNADGMVGVSGDRHLIIGSSVQGALPKPWVAADIPAPGLPVIPPPPPRPPGAPPLPPPPPPPAVPPIQPAPAFHENAAKFKFTGGDVYTQSDSFRYVFQRLVGDGSFIARVADLSADQKGARPLAGVMMRTSITADSPYVALLNSSTVGDVFLYRPTPGAQAIDTASSGACPIYFKLTRRGLAIRTYRSADGHKWEFMGESTLNMSNSVLVGVVVCAGDPAVTATAAFDHLAISTDEPSEVHEFQPSVVLTDGTRLVGAMTALADGKATIATPGAAKPTLDKVDLGSIGRIFFRPLAPEVLNALTKTQTGVFLDSGDFYEGEIQNLSPQGLNVNSVVFGLQGFNNGNLSAIIMHPISRPAGFEVDLADGSAIESSSLAVAPAGLQLHTVGGAITVALKDVQQITAH